jgi:predicted nucleotidyltransferase
MEDGIQTSVTEDEIAEFIINDGYPVDIVPISCILAGSRAYGLATTESDRDYVGIHLMDTWECLEHPDYRNDVQVIRRKFTKDLEEVPAGIKGGDISLDSFEMWKFLTLITKGSFVTYEILYMPEIHQDTASGNLIELCRAALNNRIGKAAKGNAFHDWRREKNNRKKTVMAYYRLIQAIHFLREMEFEWRSDVLWDYVKSIIPVGGEVLKTYMSPETRALPIEEGQLSSVANEVERLVDEVGRAMVITKLPDQSSPTVIQEILQVLVKTRAVMI